ncbi:uncharacterized protein LTR77_007049 [Saxophila tyrrhenica]|uniref:Heterokaryon incompatibility domain-containing protein n=1 Tax=Saxophila tyrrhenica TaxID=1690608 RepID=A0AAV9P7L6_9PEZI|nr:hypothetical protein LTR77_007049 [Saxophila tyrrhenica]
MPLIYPPLDESRKQIRLMRIHAGPDPRTMLVCSLESVDLSAANPFYALSYVWGPPSPTQSISLNGHITQIRQNLWLFLHALRARFCQRKTDTIRVWADYTCIQQSDLRELSYQVSFMVYGWLGIGHESGDEEMDRIESIRLSRRNNSSWNSISRQYSTALEVVASSPYWTRLWIKQEVILAKDVWLFQGEKAAHWNDVRFVSSLGRSRANQPQIRRATGSAASHKPQAASMLSLLDYRALHYNNLDLPELVVKFCNAGCQDARDKIYALLSLTNPDTRRQIAVNYQKPLLQVLLDNFVHWTGENIPIETVGEFARPVPRYGFQSFCSHMAKLLSSAELRELCDSPPAREAVTAEGLLALSGLSRVAEVLPIAGFDKHSIWPISERAPELVEGRGFVIRIITQPWLGGLSAYRQDRFAYVDAIPEPGDILGQIGTRIFFLRQSTGAISTQANSQRQPSFMVAIGSEPGEHHSVTKDIRRLSARQMLHPCLWLNQQLPDVSFRLVDASLRRVAGPKYVKAGEIEIMILCNAAAMLTLLTDAWSEAGRGMSHGHRGGTAVEQRTKHDSHMDESEHQGGWDAWCPYEFVLSHNVLNVWP